MYLRFCFLPNVSKRYLVYLTIGFVVFKISVLNTVFKKVEYSISFLLKTSALS